MQKSRKRQGNNNLLTNLMLLCVISMICLFFVLAAAEIMLRQKYHSENWSKLIGEAELEGLPYQLRKDMTIEFKGNFCRLKPTSVFTDSNRFRVPEKDFEHEPKKEGETLLIGLGDSTMFGWGLDYHETYLYLLEERLRDKDIDARAINAGVPSYDTFTESVLLEKKGMAFDSDIIIVGFDKNDLAGTVNYTERVKKYRPNLYDRTIRALPFIDVASHTVMSSRYIKSKLFSKKSRRYVDRTLKGFERIRNMSENANSTLIVVFKVPLADMQNATKKVYDQLEDENYNVVLVGEEINSKIRVDKRNLASCDPHPTPEVNEVMAGMVFEELKKNIPELRENSSMS